jgi:ABC-type nitrate/sulfonate/bicarbonate transport system substrate-binding protein
MKRCALVLVLPVLAAGLLLTGCSGKGGDGKGGDGKGAPVFSLAWSEYPSWSVFGVASELGLIDGKKGHQGELEKKWGVDIELNLLQYGPCMDLYKAGNCDAVCITNMDVLAPSLALDSVAILPTSTSVGADALLVVDIDVSDKQKALDQLGRHKVYGEEKSVSEYVFARNLELLGRKAKDFKFSGMAADAAATAMQTGKEDVKAIIVWNPFVLQTLKQNKKAKRLFDSSTIPGEVVDMVVMSQKSLDKEKGGDFACCVIDAFYSFNQRLEDRSKRGEMLIRLGKKFSNLNEEEMEQAVKETRFYKDAQAGLDLFTGKEFPETNKRVSKFCLETEIVKQEPKLGYGSEKVAGTQLRFDPSYIQKVRDKK